MAGKFLLVQVEQPWTSELGVVVPVGKYKVVTYRNLLTDPELLYLIQRGRDVYSIPARICTVIGRTDK